MKLKYTAVVLLALILCGTLYPDTGSRDRAQLFDEASKAYAEKKFSHALSIYESLYATDSLSFELLFNMGNTYYRLGDNGHAALYWEKAALLKPGSPELQHNMKLLSLRLQDKVVLPKGFILFEWYWQMRSRASLKGLLSFSSLLFLLAVVLHTLPRGLFFSEDLKQKLHRLARYPVRGVLVLLLILLAFAADKYRYEKDHIMAIVIPREIKVTAEPREASSVLFLLHAGSRVRIKSSVDNWYEISYFDDKVGWVKEEQIRTIR